MFQWGPPPRPPCTLEERMTRQTSGERFDGIWRVLDGQVASGRIPGYVAAVRAGGEVRTRAGGRMAVGAESAAMGEDTLFRIASITKPIGGALTLGLVPDGGPSLDDPGRRW